MEYLCLLSDKIISEQLMDFDIIGKITEIEVIASGSGIVNGYPEFTAGKNGEN